MYAKLTLSYGHTFSMKKTVSSVKSVFENYGKPRHFVRIGYYK